jgi:predicted RNA-binding Zn ribbon-like protein
MSKLEYQSNPDLIGGEVCLIFANTVGGNREIYEADYLNSYIDLVAWSRHAGLVTDHEAQHLVAEAGRRPAEADTVFERAVRLREAIYRIFSAIAAREPPAIVDLEILNEALSEALARLQVTPTGSRFAWTWRTEAEALDGMLGPIVRSAAELLMSEKLDRVTECAGDACNWLFIDTSKNHSRRWCDMRDCGNRAKAKRHYARGRVRRSTSA